MRLVAHAELLRDHHPDLRPARRRGQPRPARLQGGHALLHRRRHARIRAGDVDFGDEALGGALADLDARFRAAETRLVHVAGPRGHPGGLPVPENLQFHVDAAQRVRHRVIAVVVQRAAVYVTRQRRRKIGVAGDADFPPALAGHVHGGTLDYYCNNSVAYTLRGVHVELEILWNWEAAGMPSVPGDVYEASFRGTKSRVEIRQGPSERFVPEVYIAG